MTETANRSSQGLHGEATPSPTTEYLEQLVQGDSSSLVTLHDPTPNTRPRLTVIVPTRNEEACIPALLERLGRAMGSLSAEIIVVYDSDDDTPAVLAHHAPAARWRFGSCIAGRTLAQAASAAP